MPSKPSGETPRARLDPRYLFFFDRFNRGDYFEAHEILEKLWLQTKDADRLFFKALIQFAGAFVHLKKQRANPGHRVDGRRLAPAARLFRLAENNLRGYPPRHLRCDVAALRDLCANNAGIIERSNMTENPWNPASAPRITLD